MYEKKINSQFYDQVSTPELMKKRGIIREGETLDEVFNRIVTTIFSYDRRLEGIDDEVFQDQVRNYTRDGTFVYGTPILTNLGRDNMTTAACTVLPLPLKEGVLDIIQFKTDSYESLSSAIGTGYDLSLLENPVQELHKMNALINEINTEFSQRGKRPVACMATLRADHHQVMEFIEVKNKEDFHEWRFNISVFVTERLFEAAKQDLLWDLKDNAGVTVKQIPAKELLHHIASCAHYCAEPGVLFIDRFNRDNPTPFWEYTSTAPCAEVAMAPGEVCQFSYVNVTNMFEVGSSDGTESAYSINYAKIIDAVEIMTRVLDNTVQATIDNDFFQKSLIAAKRRIGVGITGFAGLLMNLRIPYNSPEAEKLALEIGELFDFASKKASVELAKRRGAFPVFIQSKYTNENWVRRKDHLRCGIVSENDWNQVYGDILKNGIRNASTTAYPPTGTSSQLASTSTSFEPYYQLVQWKQGYNPEGAPSPVIYNTILRAIREISDLSSYIRLIGSIYNPENKFIHQDLENFPFLATATQVSHMDHMRIQQAFQRFADESSSKTINLSNNATVDDVLETLWLAYSLQLKGVTVFRENCLQERTLDS